MDAEKIFGGETQQFGDSGGINKRCPWTGDGAQWNGGIDIGLDARGDGGHRA